MIKSMRIIKYRKLKNLEITFDEGINLIAGGNGTCKTSILHIISNSYKKLYYDDSRLLDNHCLKVLNYINTEVNPVVERLTKGDEAYNDPAYGTEGILFSVDYYNLPTLGYRRHNTKHDHRYSLKPIYEQGKNEAKPAFPVIYLGLTRFFPLGEVGNDIIIKKVTHKFPDEYLKIVVELYKKLTNIDISSSKVEKVLNVKRRMVFKSNTDGIDSNTISAGEDNLLTIVLALVSLKYYYDSLKEKDNKVNSLLIIDEIDATLHPAKQIDLLNILMEYSKQYRIQMFFTTHSITLLEYALKERENVVYLIDNVTNVAQLEDADIYKIKKILYNSTSKEMNNQKFIPVFAEDEEARIFFNLLLDYFCSNLRTSKINNVRHFFRLIDCNFGSSVLIKLFHDKTFISSNTNAICILDGDQENMENSNIITLPGDKSPEDIIFSHALHLYENEDYWLTEPIKSSDYKRLYFQQHIKPHIDSLYEKASEKKSNKIDRSKSKWLYNEHKEFFNIIAGDWINSNLNKELIMSFYADLKAAFNATASLNDIDPNEWDQ